MKKILLLLIMLISIQTISANVSIYTQPINMSCGWSTGTINNFYQRVYDAHYYSIHASWTFYGEDCNRCYSNCGGGYLGSQIRAYCMAWGHEHDFFFSNCSIADVTFSKSDNRNGYQNNDYDYYDYYICFLNGYNGYNRAYCLADGTATLIISPDPPNIVSGTTACVNKTELYIKNNVEWIICDEST